MCFSALMHNMQRQTFYTNPGFDDYKKYNTVQQNESLALREALFQFLLVWLKSASQKLPKPDCFKALFWSAFNAGFVKENYPKGLKQKHVQKRRNGLVPNGSTTDQNQHHPFLVKRYPKNISRLNVGGPNDQKVRSPLNYNLKELPVRISNIDFVQGLRKI